MAPFAKHDICSIFLMGEIAFSGTKNSFHNGAFVLTGLSEDRKYIIPDAQLLDHTEVIEEDKSFFDKRKDINVGDSEESEDIGLLDQIREYRIKYDVDDDHLDMGFMLPNVYSFEEDKDKLHYTKITLIEIQTADATIAFAGQERYHESIREILASMNSSLEEERIHVLPAYALNYKTLAIAATDDTDDRNFLKYSKRLYELFEYATPDSGLTSVARFVVVLNQENMLDFGMNLLFAHKDSQENFIICDKDVRDDTSTIEEIRSIELLKRAVDEDLIVPFYQGIYNNELGKIDKYEALMRIVDTDGKVYSPISFLETAKKYKFYKRISRMMIEKVMNDFMDRHESVSINITLYDIISSSFRRWFCNLLRKHPPNVVIEFIETEDYKSQDVLFEFVDLVRSLGAKIAVDDFGTGYSTFATIVALKPDYKKIDGSIVKTIEHSEENRIILDTICYLANRMGTHTIAEFVETQGIQDILVESGISYSQGYYFSQPSMLLYSSD